MTQHFICICNCCPVWQSKFVFWNHIYHKESCRVSGILEWSDSIWQASATSCWHGKYSEREWERFWTLLLAKSFPAFKSSVCRELSVEFCGFSYGLLFPACLCYTVSHPLLEAHLSAWIMAIFVLWMRQAELWSVEFIRSFSNRDFWRVWVEYFHAFEVSGEFKFWLWEIACELQKEGRSVFLCGNNGGALWSWRHLPSLMGKQSYECQMVNKKYPGLYFKAPALWDCMSLRLMLTGFGTLIHFHFSLTFFVITVDCGFFIFPFELLLIISGVLSQTPAMKKIANMQDLG